MWKITVGDATLTADDTIPAGDWAVIYTLSNLALDHAEVDIGPLHCPICRNIWVAYTASRGTGVPIQAALDRVAEMSRDDVLACVALDRGSG